MPGVADHAGDRKPGPGLIVAGQLDAPADGILAPPDGGGHCRIDENRCWRIAGRRLRQQLPRDKRHPHHLEIWSRHDAIVSDDLLPWERTWPSLHRNLTKVLEAAQRQARGDCDRLDSGDSRQASRHVIEELRRARTWIRAR